MSAPSSAQYGLASTATYGDHAAPTAFVPVLSPDLTYEVERVESQGIVAGLDIIGSEQWNVGNITAGGNIGQELYAGGLHPIFEQIFGGVQVVGSTTTYTPGELDGKSACIQIGRPRPGGAVIPENWLGVKFTDAEIACQQGAIATLGYGVVARDVKFGSRVVTDGVTTNASKVVTSATAALTQADKGKLVTGTGIPANTTIAKVTNATTFELSANATAAGTGVSITIGMALGTATYAAGASKPLMFSHALLTVDGVDIPWKAVTIKADLGLATGRRFAADGRIHEPLREGPRVFTGEFDKEYLGLDERSRFLNGGEFPLALAFTAGAFTAGLGGNIRYDSTPSTTDGRKISDEKIAFKFVRSGATNGSAITAQIITA